MWPNPKETAHLVTFTGKIHNEKKSFYVWWTQDDLLMPVSVSFLNGEIMSKWNNIGPGTEPSCVEGNWMLQWSRRLNENSVKYYFAMTSISFIATTRFWRSIEMTVPIFLLKKVLPARAKFKSEFRIEFW